MEEQKDYISPNLLSLEQQEKKDTYYIPKFQQTMDAGQYASERELEINALKKMAGQNNEAFMMGMNALDEPVNIQLYDNYGRMKAKEFGIDIDSNATSIAKGFGYAALQSPRRVAGWFTLGASFAARAGGALYALSGAAGSPEKADKWIREFDKGMDAFENEVKKITGIEDADAVESVVMGALGSVAGSIGTGGVLGYGVVAPAFGLAAGEQTYVRQRESEKGVGMGEALARATVHGVAEAQLEKLQFNRILGAMAKHSRPIAILKDLVENAAQEATQQMAEQGANWNIDNRSLAEKGTEILMSAAGGAVASLGGSIGGNILNKKTINEVTDLMRKTGHSEQEIKNVKESLDKIVDTDELERAARAVANDELTTIALTYKENAIAASNEISNQLDNTIVRNELVDMPSAISGEQVDMPALYQLGEMQIDTEKNPHLGMVLYQAEQAGKPFQTLGQVLEWTKGKLDTEQAQKMSTGINSVYSKTYEALKGIGQDDVLADRNARLRSAQAFAIARNYGMSVEEADNMLGGITSQRASEFQGFTPEPVQEAVQEEVAKNVEQEIKTGQTQESSLAEEVDNAVKEVAKTNEEVAEATKPSEKIEDYGEVLEGAKKNLDKTEQETSEKKTSLEKIMAKVSENRDERIVVVNWLQQQDQEFVELLAKLNRPLHAFKTPKYKNELYDLYTKHPEVKEEKPRWDVAFGSSELSKETLDKYGIKPEYDFEIEKTKGRFVTATKENIENILGNRGKVTFTFASSNRGDYYLWVKKGSQGWKPLIKFDSKEDAEKYKESHTEQELMDLYKEKSTVVKKEKPIRPRKGQDYRKGKNVTAEDFANTFGFRGVQFGNYENNEKRQRELNNAYDSLMDLATIVGIPPKAISLEGTLGIAFGARGSGSANAHYETDTKVINITRDSGAGAIGHEWFHALDNYFGGGTNMATKSTYGRDIRFELRQKLVDFLYSIETEKDFQNRLRLLGDYWKSKWEIAARVFEQYLVNKTEQQGITNDYLATEKDSAPYLTKDEQARVLPKLDDFFKTMRYEEVDGKYRLYQDEASPRGAYYNNTVYLFENADESTFVHEMAHSYMDAVERLSQGGNAQAQRDLNVIRKWLGKKQGEAFTQADWERFARGFEMYMREGKSPNEYLGGTGGVFDKFKNWLMNIYAGIRNLTVTNEKGKQEPVKINQQIKDFYDEMLGGQDIDKVLDTAEKNQQAMNILQSKLDELADAQRVLAEERARIVREMANNVKPDTTWANVKDWGKNVWDSAKELPSNVLQSSYERLAKIDPRLGLLVQRIEQSQGLRLKKWADEIQPFYEAFNNLSSEDKAKVQFYLLNQQWGDVEDIIGKDSTEAVQKMLKEVYEELVASGVEVGYRDNYFPRAVLDYDGLLQEMGLTYPQLRKEMEEAVGKDATPEQQAEWLDKHIMGFKGNVSLNQNRNTKERKLDLITDTMAKYYKPSMETLVDYMNGMAKLLSMREAFGRDIEYRESKDSAEDSIGKIINNLLTNEKLTKKEIDEVRQVLSALYLPNGMGNKFLQAMRQYGYATKLSYSTTVRQFADIGMMMKVNGVLNTLDALFHPDKRITLESLGIDPLGEEFQTSKKDVGGKIANIATKWKGINWADAVMKNAFMRGNYKSLQQLAKTPDKFHQKYDALFGDETDTLIKDLNDNKLSEPVKVLLFHEISKIQPISRSAMPTAYLSNPNGRVFYMFKTFSLHRAEYMVSELAEDFRRGDLEKAGKDIMADVAVIGWEGLVELLIAFLKYGWQAFAAKEVIDTFMGSGLGVLGLNKHQALQISRGQVGDFFQEMVGVGTPFDDIGYMIRHYDDEDKLLRAFLPDMIVEPLIAGPKQLGKKRK